MVVYKKPQAIAVSLKGDFSDLEETLENLK
jgi:hypothetical protein